MRSDSEVQIRDRNTKDSSIDLSSYPIKWNNINGKPTYMNLFGYVSHSTSSAPYEDWWPAVAVRDANGNIKSVYQFSGNGWTSTSASAFITIK